MRILVVGAGGVGTRVDASSAGALAAGADYLDMAMSLSRPHDELPYELTCVKLGDEQFAKAAGWETAERLALVGIGVEPGLSDGSRSVASRSRPATS